MTTEAAPGSRRRPTAFDLTLAVILLSLGALLLLFGGVMVLLSGWADDLELAWYLLPVGGGSTCVMFGAYLLVRLLARRG